MYPIPGATVGSQFAAPPPDLPPLLVPLLASDPRGEGEAARAAAKTLLEDSCWVCDRVIRVIADPRQTIVLFVNAHEEARTAFIAPEEGGAISIHVAQGFK